MKHTLVPCTAALAALIALATARTASAQVSLTNASPAYTEEFNTLPSSGTTAWADNATLANWYAQRAVAGTLNILGDAGGGNAGALRSFGNDAERAFGSVASNTTGALAWGVRLRNNGSSDITALNISFRVEHWRDASADTQTCAFFHRVSPSPITAITGAEASDPAGNGFTAATTFDFTSVANGNTGAIDGNAAGNQATKSGTLSVTVPVGSEIMLLWQDPNNVGNDHGVAIDSLNVVATYGGPDTTAPTATIARLDPANTGLDVVRYSVTFSESVSPTFFTDDITINTTLPSGAAISNFEDNDPSYIVSVAPNDPFENGTLSITIGTAVTDAAGNPFAGATSPEYTIEHIASVGGWHLYE